MSCEVSRARFNANNRRRLASADNAKDFTKRVPEVDTVQISQSCIFRIREKLLLLVVGELDQNPSDRNRKVSRKPQ